MKKRFFILALIIFSNISSADFLNNILHEIKVAVTDIAKEEENKKIEEERKEKERLEDIEKEKIEREAYSKVEKLLFEIDEENIENYDIYNIKDVIKNIDEFIQKYPENEKKEILLKSKNEYEDIIKYLEFLKPYYFVLDSEENNQILLYRNEINRIDEFINNNKNFKYLEKVKKIKLNVSEELNEFEKEYKDNLNKIKNIKSKYSKIVGTEIDEFEGVKYFESRYKNGAKINWAKTNFNIYGIGDINDQFPRRFLLHLEVRGEEYLGVNKVIILMDGSKLELQFGYSDFQHDIYTQNFKLISIEYINAEFNEDLYDFILENRNAKTIKIRFSGTNGYKDIIVNNSDKELFVNSIKLLEISELIDRNVFLNGE
ncbi:hypothetical protein STFE110948_04710 [Streptobacillus felis]|uniref:hypothetical protein n=1 Tax=Streptobacillus felis TaxID=1384509 RepID=UPI00082CE87A|nr:hypothetical protein [Streptobacillus felis]